MAGHIGEKGTCELMGYWWYSKHCFSQISYCEKKCLNKVICSYSLIVIHCYLVGVHEWLEKREFAWGIESPPV